MREKMHQSLFQLFCSPSLWIDENWVDDMLSATLSETVQCYSFPVNDSVYHVLIRYILHLIYVGVPCLWMFFICEANLGGGVCALYV